MFIVWLTSFLVFTALGWGVVCCALYRIPSRQVVTVKGNVIYRMVDLTMSNRKLFETLLRNKAVYIDAPSFNISPLYVSTSDYQKLWPSKLFDMINNQQTIRATLTVKPLIFGGYSVAQVDIYTVIYDRPKVIK